MADPILLLEFPVGHPHSEHGNERRWLEGGDSRETGGGAGQRWALPLPCVSISNMSEFITGSLPVIRLSRARAYINNAAYCLWLCWCSSWHQVTNNNISYESVICAPHPGRILTDGLFCPGQRTCFCSHGTPCLCEERARTPNVCHGGCHAALHSEPWALSADCVIRKEGVRSVGRGRGWLIIEVSWPQWKPAHSRPPLAHECTPACEAALEKIPPAAFFLCDAIHPLKNMKSSSLHCLTWVASGRVWWHGFDIEVKAGR